MTGKNGQANKSGQAMIEVVVGLVALMALTAGLLQVASLTMAQTETLVDARGLAGGSAMADTVISAFPDYISDITVGDDGRSYSQDDETTGGDQTAFLNVVVDPTAGVATDWDVMDSLPASPMSALHSSAAPVTEFGLVEGTATRSINLSEAVQRLLYADDSINIRSRVWMTRTEGIY